MSEVVKFQLLAGGVAALFGGLAVVAGGLKLNRMSIVFAGGFLTCAGCMIVVAA